MQISLIIPCKNESGVVDKLLSSLLDQTRPADQIIVVNSHSSDDTVARAQAFADRLPLQTIDALKRGVANARN
jgi:glycosyltransferase involved in cell wall biosynthesis